MPSIPWDNILAQPHVYLQTTAIPIGITFKHPGVMPGHHVFAFAAHIRTLQDDSSAPFLIFCTKDQIMASRVSPSDVNHDHNSNSEVRINHSSPLLHAVADHISPSTLDASPSGDTVPTESSPAHETGVSNTKPSDTPTTSRNIKSTATRKSTVGKHPQNPGKRKDAPENPDAQRQSCAKPPKRVKMYVVQFHSI
jgi:hypothetical protein